jgi:hypothetical protein
MSGAPIAGVGRVGLAAAAEERFSDRVEGQLTALASHYFDALETLNNAVNRHYGEPKSDQAQGPTPAPVGSEGRISQLLERLQALAQDIRQASSRIATIV